MDDWIVKSYNIPSVTVELGNNHDFIYEWKIESAETAF